MATVEERLSHLEGQMQEQSHGYSELRESVRDVQHRMDMRFDGLEQRVDARFQHMEQRLDARFQQVEQRFDARLQQVEQRCEARFDILDRRQITTLVALVSGFAAVIAALLAR